MSKTALATTKPAIVAASEAEQRKLGEQITTQFRRVVNGLADYIALGGLIEQVRRIVPTCGHNPARGRQTKGDGIKGWLSTYAPDVTRQTADRCENLAEAIRAEFKLAKKVDLYALMMDEKLDAKGRATREKVLSFLQGKSQRQILLSIGTPEAQLGGKRTSTKQQTPEERHNAKVEAVRTVAKCTFSQLYDLKHKWKFCDDTEITVAVEAAEQFVKDAKKWLATPPPARAQPDIDQLLDDKAKADDAKADTKAGEEVAAK